MRRALPSLLAFALAALVFAGDALARAPRFALGELSLPPRTAERHRQLLTDALTAEFAANESAASQDAYVINARLKQLRTERARTSRTRCALALVLTRADSGTIYAIAEAKVMAEDARAEQSEQAAIQAATKTAMERVVSSLRARRQPLASR